MNKKNGPSLGHNKKSLLKSEVEHIDITSFESINKGLDLSLKNSDKIDILVNNAGIAGPSFKTWEYPIKDWQKVIDINNKNSFHMPIKRTPIWCCYC